MQRTLADNLILRSLSEGIASDKENLSAFYVDVFTDAYGPEDKIIGNWVPDLLSEKHPSVTDEDVWVVVDPARDSRIVSALLLIPQTWRYAGVEFEVGRVELVATHKDYRRRGLIRELFNTLHERSADLGHDIQAITGIPYFYRQFGYAMAVHLGSCGIIPFGIIPDLKEDQEPDFTLRDATLNDIPQLMVWDESLRDQYLLTTRRDAHIWEYEMLHRSEKAAERLAFKIIVNKDGLDVGYVGLAYWARYKHVQLFEYVVGGKSSYLATLNDVLRGVREHGQAHFDDKEPHAIRIHSNLYGIISALMGDGRSAAIRQTHYAWYIRVPDLVSFLTKIKPVLEQRLEGSLAHRYTGSLKISFYKREGLVMEFEDGCIKSIKMEEIPLEKEEAAFPFDTFLNVLFGHQPLATLGSTLADVGYNPKAFTLLNILFPQQDSYLAPLE